MYDDDELGEPCDNYEICCMAWKGTIANSMLAAYEASTEEHCTLKKTKSTLEVTADKSFGVGKCRLVAMSPSISIVLQKMASPASLSLLLASYWINICSISKGRRQRVSFGSMSRSQIQRQQRQHHQVSAPSYLIHLSPNFGMFAPRHSSTRRMSSASL